MALESTGNLVADAFLRLLDEAGFADASAGAVVKQDGAIVINKVAAGGEGRKGLTIELVTLEEGSVNADNALSARTITYDTIQITNETGATTSTIDRAEVAGALLAIDPSTDAGIMALLGRFERLSLSTLTARSNQNEEIAVARIAATVAGRDGDTVTGGSLEVDDLVIKADLLDESAARQLANLGYDTLTVDISGSGAWSPSGEAELREGRVFIDAMGGLELDADVAGLTRDVVATVSTAGANFSLILQAMGAITLNTVTLRYEDAGLIDRLLGLGEEETELDRQKLVDQIVTALGPTIADLGSEEFVSQTQSTITGFLMEPGQLSISAKPQKPVSALEVIGAAMINPSLLSDILALKIERQ